ncbi:GMC family oxidoreductase [Nocardiopsis sp. EMB25]|uniref:GMC family oxidoreductase n=1 Tax=Nocardiopsis sp. EMB25 TaxID=2835867 RepID=UPI00228451E5|nr:GMC family oxidoreductase [Nocardiopsis sp. EMB25]MCY9784341.1 GMC family oxidoreductase [Nocardiopsis sp. EMB25]
MTAAATGPETRRDHYDAVIVGAGWSGSLIAGRLGRQGWRVLLLEAGEGGTESWSGHLDSVSTYRSAVAKVPNSAYRHNTAAPSPDVLDLSPKKGGGYTADGYFVQDGPLPYRTDYLRALGGSGMHWLGAVPRMHADDFATGTTYGYGRDWPFTAKDLEPYYEEAERELGVAGDAAEQRKLGVVSDPDYVYPMHAIPRSHIDEHCRRIDGAEITDPMEDTRTLHVTGIPQARNSTPNPAYDRKKGYRPKGAVGLPNYGERCVGNASCVPICPAQAKSSPLRVQADLPENVTLLTRRVVTRVLRGQDTRVRGVEYRAYNDPASSVSEARSVRADIVVLAGHAIENARLLLFSELAKTSDQVGRNLMDHPTTLAWALAERSVGPYRGPGHTSGWEDFRFHGKRGERAPFRIEISNWGWSWATGAPMSNVTSALGLGGDAGGTVKPDGLLGPDLRRKLGDDIGRQLQLQIAVEQSANPKNRVTIDPSRHRDALGNPRPILTYDLDPHTRDGVYAAYRVSEKIFAALGATPYTDHKPVHGVPQLGHFRHRETDLTYQGAGHGAGTHIMGEHANDSVVDSYQRTHDHPNLYAVGCGSMPSIGTSNPTLTMSALALRSAEQIHRDLAALNQPVVVRSAAGEKEKA